MSLKTFVKVGNISNLSDARYCAGMGVNILGFNIDPSAPDYVSAETFEEISGWVAGVEYCGEINHNFTPDLDKVLDSYGFKYVQSNDLQFLDTLSGLEKIYLLEVSSQDDISSLAVNIQSASGSVDYMLIECNDEHFFDAIDQALSNQQLRNVIKGYNVNEDNVLDVEKHGFLGISLKGTAEIRPGYKDYDELADILEVLDED